VAILRIAAAVALFVCGTCAAQPAPPVERPDVNVGDRWTYQRLDYDAGKPLGKPYEVQVVFAQRGVIQVVGNRQGVEEEVDATFTSDWNGVNMLTRVFNPHTGWFKFPLQVGDTYKASYETLMPKKNIKSRNERQVSVVGWEEIVVPAGKFRALKIVSDGRFQRLDAPGAGTSRNVIWYVPEVKRWVKITLESRPASGRGGEHMGEELVAFRLR
jgi:hypothetical protein